MVSLFGFAARARTLPLLVVTALTLGLPLGCHGAQSNFLAELDDARRLAADLRVQFNKAADASNRSVMADTDESSLQFAHDAELGTRAVETDLATLRPLLHNLGYSGETRSLEQFGEHFAAYRKLDHDILALAVENTNLKAQRLSFGPVRDAADAFRASLESMIPGFPTKDRCQGERLVNKAVLAVREIQVLQAPHIAAPDDAQMTRLEQEMAAREGAARQAVSDLSGLALPNGREPLAAAGAALDRFHAVAAQIVTLSRKNTNVRSLDLALRVKPPLTAACDDSLRALQDALGKEGSKATR